MIRGSFSFLLILIGLSTHFNFAQAENADTSAIRKLNQRAEQLYLTQPDSALILANQALAIAQQTNFYLGQGYSHLQISRAQWVFNNYDLSLFHAFNALKVFDSLKDESLLFEALLELGRTYLDRKDYDNAEEYYTKALKISENSADQAQLGDINRNLGIFYSRKKQYSKALAYTLDALKIAKELNNEFDQAILYNHIGVIHDKEKNYSVALEYFNKSLEMAIATGNKRLESITYARLGDLNIKLADISKGIEYHNKALKLANQIGSIDASLLALSGLIEGYKIKQDYKTAFLYSQKYQQYNDSIYTIEKEKIIANISQGNQLESKQREIRYLSKENELKEQKARNQTLFLILLIGGLFLAITLSIVLYRSNLKNRENNKALKLKNEEIIESRNEISLKAADLRSLNHVKDRLFSIIGHDLKGPIGNLQALLKMLNNKNITQEEFNHLTPQLKRNIDNTRITLDNLLNWSLSQMDGIKTNPKTIALKKSIDETILLFADDIEHKKISIEQNINPDLEITADPAQLSLVFRNLLSNAIKFTPQSGKVSISVDIKNREALIKITDTGIGLKPDQIEKLLLPGTHQSQRGTDNEKGTGLGLMLCKDFIERNGGTLHLESKPNLGSTFSFNLPIS